MTSACETCGVAIEAGTRCTDCGAMLGDGVVLMSADHPQARGWDSWEGLRLWLRMLRVRLFGFRHTETVEIDIEHITIKPTTLNGGMNDRLR